MSIFNATPEDVEHMAQAAGGSAVTDTLRWALEVVRLLETQPVRQVAQPAELGMPYGAPGAKVNTAVLMRPPAHDSLEEAQLAEKMQREHDDAWINLHDHPAAVTTEEDEAFQALGGELPAMTAGDARVGELDRFGQALDDMYAQVAGRLPNGTLSAEPIPSCEDTRQMIYALERQALALEEQARKLFDQRDYSAEFPAADAEALRRAARMLGAIDVVPEAQRDDIANALGEVRAQVFVGDGVCSVFDLPQEAQPADTTPLQRQEGGAHYKAMKVQPVEYIHANGIGYFEGNVIKYVSRWRVKGGMQDLKKARHYLDLLMELEGGAA